MIGKMRKVTFNINVPTKIELKMSNNTFLGLINGDINTQNRVIDRLTKNFYSYTPTVNDVICNGEIISNTGVENSHLTESW